MALHDTQAKRERQANKDLAIKLALEVALIVALRKYFTKLSREMRALYAGSGGIINVADSREELNEILTKHYGKVSNKFKDQIMNHDDVDAAIKKDEALIERIDLEIKHKNIHNINRSLAAISKTNQKDAIAAINNELLSSATGEETLTREEIATNAAIKFKAKAFARVNTIAITETQKPAESTKFIEAVNISEKTVQKTTLDKTWNAVLDEKTRPGHADADGQTVVVKQPFIVSGEPLPVPGDDSLGASIGNIINCRCAAIYHSKSEVIR